jgi:hypothetical protein
LWVQEPVFSNADGRVTFEGVVLNPGYTGSGGKILTLTLKAKGTGTARLSFSSGSVLANDGKGTNILTAMTGTTVTIGPSTPDVDLPSTGDKPEVTPAPPGPLPPAPIVRSSTHPDSGQWYSDNAIAFQWDVPHGVTAVRLLLDQQTNTQPTVTYGQALRSKTIDSVDDGVWYFHIQFRNASGWGATTHLPVRIDATPPDTLLVKRVDEGGLAASFNLQASDVLSGIDRFEIQTDGEPPQIWPNAGTEVFTFGTTALEVGQHTFTVTAYDKAGNGLSESQVFWISATTTAAGEVGSQPDTAAVLPRPVAWWQIPGWVLGIVGFLVGSLGSVGLVFILLRKRRATRSSFSASRAVRMTPLAVRGIGGRARRRVHTGSQSRPRARSNRKAI